MLPPPMFTVVVETAFASECSTGGVVQPLEFVSVTAPVHMMGAIFNSPVKAAEAEAVVAGVTPPAEAPLPDE